MREDVIATWKTGAPMDHIQTHGGLTMGDQTCNLWSWHVGMQRRKKRSIEYDADNIAVHSSVPQRTRVSSLLAFVSELATAGKNSIIHPLDKKTTNWFLHSVLHKYSTKSQKNIKNLPCAKQTTYSSSRSSSNSPPRGPPPAAWARCRLPLASSHGRQR